jgi:hypothetical protein
MDEQLELLQGSLTDVLKGGSFCELCQKKEEKMAANLKGPRLCTEVPSTGTALQ